MTSGKHVLLAGLQLLCYSGVSAQIMPSADLASPGSTVYVRGGSYEERVTINVSGNAGGGYTIFRSYPGETAILEGQHLTPDGRSGMLVIQDKSYIRIQGFEIRNYRTNDERRTPMGISVLGGGAHIELLGNNVHHIEQTFAGRDAPGRGGNAFGIAVYGTDAKAPIDDLVIDGNTGEFQMQYNMTNNVFENNIVYAGSRCLMTSSKSAAADGGPPTVTMDYNLYYCLAGPEASQWAWHPNSYISFAKFVQASNNDQHSRFADPRFVNPAASDFHLQSGSPAINAGANLGLPVEGDQDLDGRPRVKAANIDMGCYEAP